MTTIEAPKTTPKEVTTADVLERAAGLVEHCGWAQGSEARFSEPGPFCLSTALTAAYEDRACSRYMDRSTVVRLRLSLGFKGAHFDQLVRWNDTPGRTKSEVVSLLRQAAERSRETA